MAVRCEHPVLVIGAEADRIFSSYEVRATARAFGTTATIFPEMGYTMMLEPDWLRVAEHVAAWLETTLAARVA